MAVSRYRTLVSGIQAALSKRWRNFLVLPVCNLKRDRAPVVYGYCFPLCWRCTAICGGLFAARLGFQSRSPVEEMCAATALILPCAVDAVFQYCFKVESTNARRIMLGLAAGLGIGVATKAYWNLGL